MPKRSVSTKSSSDIILTRLKKYESSKVSSFEKDSEDSSTSSSTEVDEEEAKQAKSIPDYLKKLEKTLENLDDNEDFGSQNINLLIEIYACKYINYWLNNEKDNLPNELIKFASEDYEIFGRVFEGVGLKTSIIKKTKIDKSVKTSKEQHFDEKKINGSLETAVLLQNSSSILSNDKSDLECAKNLSLFLNKDNNPLLNSDAKSMIMFLSPMIDCTLINQENYFKDLAVLIKNAYDDDKIGFHVFKEMYTIKKCLTLFKGDNNDKIFERKFFSNFFNVKGHGFVSIKENGEYHNLDNINLNHDTFDSFYCTSKKGNINNMDEFLDLCADDVFYIKYLSGIILSFLPKDLTKLSLTYDELVTCLLKFRQNYKKYLKVHYDSFAFKGKTKKSQIGKEDYRWNMAQEINCIVIFFHICKQDEFIDKYEDYKANIEEQYSDLFLDKEDFFNQYAKHVSEVDNITNSDINIIMKLFLEKFLDKSQIAELKCKYIEANKFAEEEKILRTFKTLGSFALNDFPNHFTFFQKHWCQSALNNVLKKEEKNNAIGEFASRLLWQKCIGSTKLGSSAKALKTWYIFNSDKNAYLKPSVGLGQLISMIKDVVMDSLTTICSNFEENYKKYEIKFINNPESNSIKNILELNKNYFTELSNIIKKLNDTTYRSILDYISNSNLLNVHDFSIYENKQSNLIAFENVVLELLEDEAIIRKGKIEDFITKSTGIRLVKEDKSIQKAEKYLKQVFPNTDIYNYMLKDMASYFFGKNSEKIFRIWTGNGNNSKSILIKIIQNMLGDYCIDFPCETLTESKKSSGSEASPAIADAENTRIAVMTEPPTNLKLDGGMIKKHTGGDRIRTRKLFENGGSFEATYKVILCCNDPPEIEGTDEAVKARVVMTPFESKWSLNAPENEEEQLKKKMFKIDPHFEKNVPILAKGLAYLLYQNYALYKKEGLGNVPEAMIMSVQNYWNNNDIYSRFCKECIEDKDEMDNEVLKIKIVYEHFATFFQNENPNRKNIPPFVTFKNCITRPSSLGEVSIGGSISVSGWLGKKLRVIS